ncbi:MAG: hypothetical protein ACJ779_10865 [Chloroflexota bacterium]
MAAVFAVLLLILDPLAAIPWLVATWSVLLVSGYRIWRIDHPHESARGTLAPRVYLVLSSLVAGIGLFIVRANPIVFVVVLAVWLVLMALLGLALWSVSRGRKVD